MLYSGIETEEATTVWDMLENVVDSKYSKMDRA
jgi:hypothetical protein